MAIFHTLLELKLILMVFINWSELIIVDTNCVLAVSVIIPKRNLLIIQLWMLLWYRMNSLE